MLWTYISFSKTSVNSWKDEAERRIGFLSRPAIIYYRLVKFKTEAVQYSLAVLLQCIDCTVQPQM